MDVLAWLTDGSRQIRESGSEWLSEIGGTGSAFSDNEPASGYGVLTLFAIVDFNRCLGRSRICGRLYWLITDESLYIVVWQRTSIIDNENRTNRYILWARTGSAHLRPFPDPNTTLSTATSYSHALTTSSFFECKCSVGARARSWDSSNKRQISEEAPPALTRGLLQVQSRF